jgi:hypothetical protein
MMRRLSPLRSTHLFVVVLVLLQRGGPAYAAGDAAPVAGASAATNAVTPGVPATRDASPGAGSDVTDLLQLIHDSKLIELRTTYNGNYGASLFFWPQEMVWYVALFQNQQFWRVIRSADETRAQAIYTAFARQTAQLAEVEIRRTQLQARLDFYQRMIVVMDGQARRLQADLDVARQQQASVDTAQQHLRAQATALAAQKAAAEAQLHKVQDQVRALQRETEDGLPKGGR